MPHVIVKLWPGKTEEQKNRLADAIFRDVVEVLGSKDASVSVSIEEVDPTDWTAQVYEPDIAARPDILYRKPGYAP